MLDTREAIRTLSQNLPYRLFTDEQSRVISCDDTLRRISGLVLNGHPIKLDSFLHLDSTASQAMRNATQSRQPQCFRASVRIRNESLLPVYWTVVPDASEGYQWYGFPAALRDQIEGRLTEMELLLASLTDMVFELDKDGNYINFWVRDPGSLFIEPVLFLGRNVKDVIREYFTPLESNLRPAYDEAVRENKIVVTEYQLPGTDDWFSCRFAPILNPAVEMVGMIISIGDITPQKKLELELREKEKSYRDLFENANDMIYIIDENSCVRSMNRQAQALLEYTQEEMQGVPSHLFFAPEKLAEAIRQGQNKKLDGESLTVYESELISRNGRRIPVEISSRLILKEGRVDGIHVTARDMTNHKKAQQELANSEAKFRFLSEYARDLICLHRPNGDYIYISPASSQMLGYHPDELSNHSPYEFFHPLDDTPANRDALNENSKALSGHTVQYRFRKKDGSYIWLETVSKPILEEGEVIYIQTNSRDISYRKKVEQQLREKDRLSSALANASKRLLVSHSIEDGLQQCLEVLAEGLQVECLFVLRTTSRGSHLYRIWCRSHPCSVLEKEHLFHGADVLLDKEKKHMAGYVEIWQRNETNSEEVREWMEDLGYHSILLTPIITSEGAWGALGCGQKSMPKIFTGTEIDTITTFASSVSTVVEKDIRDRQLRRSEYLVQLEKEVLEMHTGSDAPLSHIADHLLRGIESMGTGLYGAVCLVEKNQRDAVSLAVPGLPAAYADFVNNTPLDPALTTCGKAVQSRAPVLIPDISQSDLAESTRRSAESLGLKASWSIPLISSSNEIIGVLAIYFTEARLPRSYEETMIGRATHILTMIIENKQAAEKLWLSNERYLMATRASGEAIWDWDAIEQVSFWGEGFNTLFGYPSGFYYSSTNNWEDKIHPGDRERVLASIARYVTGEKRGFFNEEYRFLKADGTYALVVDKAYCVYNEEGNVIRMVGSCEDITERKRMEEALVQQEIHKQQQVAQTVVDVQESERAEIGKELHDNVNQLLTTAKLFLEVAANDEGLAKDMIRRSSDTIMNAINEIRSISRSLMPASISDLGLVSSINDLVENIMLTRQLEVDFRHKGKLDKLLHPKQKLTLFRIIQEQVNNVLKHSRATRLVIDLAYTPAYTRLEIIDDGTGFDLNDVKMKNGLGLSNIMSRAAIFNAGVTVNTAPGKGCHLTIDLPNTNKE